MLVDTYITRSKTLLEMCESQFRFYAEQHRKKIAAWQAEHDGSDIPAFRSDRQAKINDTIAKADANEKFANRIREFLDDVI